MRLQIKKNFNVYEIKGQLVAKNIRLFKKYFSNLLGKSKVVIVSLDKIKDIDEKGVKVMLEMYREAMSKETILYILGKNNERVYNMFKEQKKNYVLHNFVLSINC